MTIASVQSRISYSPDTAADGNAQSGASSQANPSAEQRQPQIRSTAVSPSSMRGWGPSAASFSGATTASRVRRDTSQSSTPIIPGVRDLKPLPSPDGQQRFVGKLPGGEAIVLTKDPFGNVQGVSGDRYYFRKADAPATDPLAPLTQKEYVKQRDPAYLAKIPGVSSVSFFKSSSAAPPGKTSPENDYYRGHLPDGTEVFLHVDSWGNLHGADKNGHYYYQKDVASNPQALEPLSVKQYAVKVLNGELENDGDEFTIDHVFAQIANPFHGLGDLLQLAGVDEETANSIEGWVNNPLGHVIDKINRSSSNALGKLFGLSEQEFGEKALAAGELAKNFVPMYGQVNFFSDLVRKAVHNEPMTPEEQLSLGAMLKMEARAPASPKVTDDIQKDSAPTKEASKAKDVMTPEELKSKTKPDAKNVYWLKSEPYVIHEGKVKHVLLSIAKPNSAYVIENGVQTGEKLVLNGKGDWVTDDTPKILGGNRPTGSKQQTVLPDASDIDESKLVPADGGIYEAQDGGQYIKMDGKVYRVIQDAAKGTTKVVDPKDPYGFKHGVYVAPDGKGSWLIVGREGLPSGEGIDAFAPSSDDLVSYHAFLDEYHKAFRNGEPLPDSAGRPWLDPLKDRANALHQSVDDAWPVSLDEPPPMKPLGENPTDKDIIKGVYDDADGMVVGERHDQGSAPFFLIQNLETLKSQGVNKLYLEGFDSIYDQRELDHFFETGEISERLDNSIYAASTGYGQGGLYYLFKALLTQARALGIRPVALEPPFAGEFMSDRIGDFNHYATQRIQTYQAQHPGKWVALTGASHTSFFPGDGHVHVGIAPRTRARSVNVENRSDVSERTVFQRHNMPKNYGASPDVVVGYPKS